MANFADDRFEEPTMTGTFKQQIPEKVLQLSDSTARQPSFQRSQPITDLRSTAPSYLPVSVDDELAVPFTRRNMNTPVGLSSKIASPSTATEKGNSPTNTASGDPYDSIPTRLAVSRGQNIGLTYSQPLAVTPPAYSNTATIPGIRGLPGGAASHSMMDSADSSIKALRTSAFQDAHDTLPRSGYSWQLGHEGYYYKNDLEELYSLWRSQYFSNEPSPLSLHHIQQRKSDEGRSAIFEATVDPVENKDTSSSVSVNKGKGVWRHMSVGPSYCGSDDTKFKKKEDVQRERYVSVTAKGIDNNKSKDARWNSIAQAHLNKSTAGSYHINADIKSTGISEEEDVEEDEEGGREEEEEVEEYNSDGDLQEELTGKDAAGSGRSLKDQDADYNYRKGSQASSSVNGDNTTSKTMDRDLTPNGNPRRLRVQESKNHRCEECGKLFSRPSQLTTHSFTHSGEKPHQCPMCQKHFNVASNLKRHIRTHNNSKRKSLRNGSMVFRGFSQGYQIRLNPIASSGSRESGSKGDGAVSQSAQSTLQPSDRLRWVSTETPFSGSIAASHKTQKSKKSKSEDESGAG
ncbi:hypothetical protein BGX27_002075 [Mortierella sp. AM989]|nr:hypothetical protein BGX27_002075 [Mortierella sp. AM989]